MIFGTVKIEKPLCLAPMEDITDKPFRLLCKEMGADVLYTEFANCEAVIRNVTREVAKMSVIGEEGPIGVQIYGSNETSLERAAEMAEEAGANFVDFNAGCWVRKIANRGDGAGLLRDLPRFQAAVAAVQRGTKLPVTVKTRLGWDLENIVAVEVAQMLEGMGVQALTMHCRTRVQGYSGEADWSWLARIRQNSGIPLIANGDIVTAQDVQYCYELGCDGVMIGRAAIQSPWVFHDIKHYFETGKLVPARSLQERVNLCIRHLRAHVAFRGLPRGIYSFRRFYSGYLKGMRNISHLRRDLMTYTQVEPVIERLHAFVESYEEDFDELDP
ncbi:MAG: tRNA-dihydrouridine synthase [Candidatus Hydrogenedentes bacterium]|nr:tRNA-dihydrouridine synthase [Candidatus Hydrogenedentota bacterium]